MGLRTLYDRDNDYAVLYESVSMTALPPIFMEQDGYDAIEVCEAFYKFVDSKQEKHTMPTTAREVIDYWHLYIDDFYDQEFWKTRMPGEW